MPNSDLIIREFTELIKQANNTKENGWRFKVNNYRKVTNILRLVPDTTTLTTTSQVLEILRDGNMKF